MKWNYKAVFSAILEYLVLLVPPIGYSVYSYVSTLQYVMSEKQVAGFWATFSVAIVAIVIISLGHKRFKELYRRYVDGYVQQKTDLETHQTDNGLIAKVSEKSKIIESVDYIAMAVPLLIVTLLLWLFRDAINEIITILCCTCGGLFGKAGMHAVTVSLKAKGMNEKIKKGD